MDLHKVAVNSNYKKSAVIPADNGASFSINPERMASGKDDVLS